MHLNDDFLKHFMTIFYGSGNYAGKYWFVGMEEGGGNDLESVTERLNAWHELGEIELVDLLQFHLLINYPEYFTNPVKLQRTWMQQARIVLASKGLPSSTEHVRAYQRDLLGRHNDETCLLELFPLPSPSTSVWNYSRWSGLAHLRDRETYRHYCAPWRIDHIRTQIRTYQPALVVFFSLGYLSYWQSIAGQTVIFREIDGFLAGKDSKTTYIIAKHPVAHGLTNQYFELIGAYLYQHM